MFHETVYTPKFSFFLTECYNLLMGHNFRNFAKLTIKWNFVKFQVTGIS